MTTREKLLHIAAQMEQLKRELEAIGRPISMGGAADISMAASHGIGVAQSFLFYGAGKLTKIAGELGE